MGYPTYDLPARWADKSLQRAISAGLRLGSSDGSKDAKRSAQGVATLSPPVPLRAPKVVPVDFTSLDTSSNTSTTSSRDTLKNSRLSFTRLAANRLWISVSARKQSSKSR